MTAGCRHRPRRVQAPELQDVPKTGQSAQNFWGSNDLRVTATFRKKFLQTSQTQLMHLVCSEVFTGSGSKKEAGTAPTRSPYVAATECYRANWPKHNTVYLQVTFCFKTVNFSSCQLFLSSCNHIASTYAASSSSSSSVLFRFTPRLASASANTAECNQHKAQHLKYTGWSRKVSR